MIKEVMEMRDTNERPVCHRAEDLVTYLYGEAGEADTLDFREHLKACDACRSEFAMFHQVHDSIVTWRNEVLGASFNSAPVTTEPTPAGAFVAREPRLSALAAIRKFFDVSPLWLRGATAFAALLLCVLAVMVISRWSQRPVQVVTVNPELKYSQNDLDSAVRKGIDARLAELRNQQTSTASDSVAVNPKEQPRTEPAVYRGQSKKARPKGLTLQERRQLAADLRLLPEEDELPFGVSSEEPNQ